ncbi:MAG: glycosyltransferase family 2 protein [Candidatus Saccharimonadales bacterium]
MKKPLVSVVMTVYNGERYLAEAIDSILSQTFTDFEFLIVDDGSTDKTSSIIQSFADPRIILIKHKNIGVAASCNKAIQKAKGTYIARQDADDVSMSNRLEAQVILLNENSDIHLVGSNIKLVDKKLNFMSYSNLLTHPDDLHLGLVFSNQIAQGAVMTRKQTLIEAGLYDPAFSITHDYDLWARIAHSHKLMNLKDYLYIYRVHEESLSTSSTKVEETRRQAKLVRDREFDYYIRHKNEYKLMTWHPRSMLGGLKCYLRRKNYMYRCMAWMYCNTGSRRRAVPILLLATIHAPWIMKSYKQLAVTLKNRQSALKIEYEFF